jgi:SNF2 family DNA or RNA helicase
MSSSETARYDGIAEDDDYDEEEEDLSAPPKRGKNPSVCDEKDADDDTVEDEDEIQEISLDQYRSSMKRKRDGSCLPASVQKSPKRPEGNTGSTISKSGGILKLDGEKLVWSEAEEAADISKDRIKNRKQSSLPARQARKKKMSTTTGVGRRRRGGVIQHRPRNRLLNLGTSLGNTVLTTANESESEISGIPHLDGAQPYHPPEPIVFSDMEADNLTERPSFDAAPPAAKEDLLLASGGIIPAPIAQWLRSYQVEGVEFMYRRWMLGRGGILGDDMGLGSKYL